MDAEQRERVIGVARRLTITPPEQLTALVYELSGRYIGDLQFEEQLVYLLGWTVSNLRLLLEIIDEHR